MRFFYRGRHRPNRHRESVAEIAEQVAAQPLTCHQTWRKRGWHVLGGKFYCLHGTVLVPTLPDPDSGVVLIKAPKSEASIPISSIDGFYPFGRISEELP